MIKRTIEISQQAVHLSVRHRQLVLQPLDEDKSKAVTIPCEDIGVVLIEHPAVSYTHHALIELVACGASVVFCGKDHLPAGLLLPVTTHTQVASRIQDQIQASKPTTKRLWQQIIIDKIQRQADNLAPETAPARMLQQLASEVKTGDTTNAEGQAARIYWASWLADSSSMPRFVSSLQAGQGLPLEGFRRDQDGLDPINAMLNYGYAILRAALGRAIVAAGMIPALGIAHHHRANAFALADDLIEPYRPLVDARVRSLLQRGAGGQGLDQSTKAALLGLLTHEVRHGSTRGPLMVGLHRYVGSFVKCLSDVKVRLQVPVWNQPPFE